MIFQIDYQSGGKYDVYFDENEHLTHQIDYFKYDDYEIQKFLSDYGYTDLFYDKKVDPKVMCAEKAIRCDLLRLLILYEIGGVYVDADVSFTREIVTLESDLTTRYSNRNIVLMNRSLYFIKGLKKSRYIKHMIDLYVNSDFLHLDVIMNKKHEIVKFHDELMVVPNNFLSRYFAHNRPTKYAYTNS